MPKLLDWTATSADGIPLSRQEFVGTANLPLGFLRSMNIQTSHPAARGIRVACKPEHDETIRVFTRRSMASTMGGQPLGEVGETVVIEIGNAITPGRFVRLYLRADGIVLSSEELHG